jgi:putative transposase
MGRRRYFLTCVTHNRLRLFESDIVAETTLRELMRASDEHGFAVLAYCLMPDHVHLLVEGVTPTAELRSFVRVFRRRAAWKCREITGLRLWQRGYHDRVLRERESTDRVVAYIVSNPVRARLVTHATEYRYSWAEGWPPPARQPSGVAERSSV